ncbi:EAL domain-containing protein [Halomonas sp. TBZ9]|uniref:EAL domain-containing protein n=1 Tax=Vreelandella azerica TaxID=2732867 RepID=A0A7Y3TYL6_9GAMM|nr:EAL domain-containing protein [Halomonas azerica]NOG32358.1 EAL domain-containing protein [Halomonas azerica]
MIGDEQIVLFQLYRSGLNVEMKRVGESLYTGLNSMAVKEGEHLLKNILDKGIAHAREQGVIERINAKWLGEMLPSAPIKWREYWPHALIIIIGALWVVAWNLRLRHLVRRKTDELRLAASVFRNAHDAIMLTNEQGNILDVNAAFTRTTGYEAAEVLNQPSALLKHLFDTQRDNSPQATLANDGVWQGEIWEKRKNGERYPIQLTLSLVKDTATRSTHFVIVFTDISRQKEYESRLQHLAYFDRLTDLPNREGFTQRLTQIMQEARESQHSVMLAYLDLDGFKEINDRYDHSLGDQVLRVVAERLRSTLKNNDIVARLGGDEFVMVLPHQPCDLEMQRVIQQLIQRVNQPIRFKQCELQISASVGVAAYDGNEDIEPDQFIRQADHAMYQAKQLGKNRYHLFDLAHERAVRGHHQSIARMQQALADDEFVLFYQPKINMRNGNIIGVEALIRWQHPEQGLLPPAMFLPEIQQHPFAIALGEWVVNSALQQCSDWKANGIHWPVSVNIDGIHLQHPHFTQWLSDTLDTFPDYAPGDLEIEALESSALDDMQGVADIMRQCQTLGVNFALDDFGTGYSTLAYLRYLPARILKIDRSFVLNMLDNEEDLVMLKGVLSLADAFQRRVIAEGVETTAHAKALLAMGCEYGQGYAFARPMPASQLLEWKTHFTLTEGTTAHRSP